MPVTFVPMTSPDRAAEFEPLTLQEIHDAHALIAQHVLVTPSINWPGEELSKLIGPKTRVSAKLELLQRTGSFKARGALVNMLKLTEEQRARGITAVSAGNHAIAAAWAARWLACRPRS
jgi:threonine dehydratase